MSKQKMNLIVAAHPDDESIYFSGLIMQKSDLPWALICVTDGNADMQKEKRSLQLQMACKKLNISKLIQLDYPDIYDKRLNVVDLSNKLKSFLKSSFEIHNVYTHGIIGEYGHPHHQDVSYAVHLAFKDVYSVSYNCYPDLTIKLTNKEYQLKTNILSNIYGSEINRFAHLVSGTWSEGFSQVDLTEIENIYQYIVHHKTLEIEKLNKYKWLFQHIIEVLGAKRNRIF